MFPRERPSPPRVDSRPGARAACAGALALALVLASAAHAQTPRLVYDARGPHHQGRATRAEKALLERVIPPEAARYFSDMNDCGGSIQVLDVARGSFTRPGAVQRAILYEWCRPAVVIAAEGVAVVEHGRLVAHAVTGDWPYELRRIPDVDGDGRDELLTLAAQTEQGTTWTWAAVLSLPPRRAVTYGFQVEQDDCGTLEDHPRQRAWPLYVVPGPRPRFLAREYEAACEHPRWRVRGRLRRPSEADVGFARVR